MVCALTLFFHAALTLAEPGLVGCEGALAREFSRAPDAYGTITTAPPVNVETLTAAYLNGFFPMAFDSSDPGDPRVMWRSPARRGLLYLHEVRVPRTDRKAVRRLGNSGEYDSFSDRDCAAVIRRCARPSWSGGGQWMNDAIVDAYAEAFRVGLVRCESVYRGGRLVAGNYGFDVGGVYSGESMFHDESNAGKIAFDRLISRLRAEGRIFLDVQQAAPPKRGPDRVILPNQSISLPVRYGAIEVSRRTYHLLLRAEQARALAR